MRLKGPYEPVDDSWIDSFDRMPNCLRSTITEEEKANFVAKLANIDDDTGILYCLPGSFSLKAKERRKHFANLTRLKILYRGKYFCKKQMSCQKRY